MTDTPNGTPPPPPQTPPAAPPPQSPPPSTSPPPPGGTESPNRAIMIVLSYFGLLALIPLLVDKDDPEVQWHAKHGLVLTVAWVVLFVVLQILVMILGAISGGLGCVFGLLMPLLALAILVIHVICIVKGLNGERFLIPGLSEFADRF
jgi:uncharacterized membrane protein